MKSVRRIFCVEYARLRSGIEIFGDAKTWWERAGAQYAKNTEPQPGAVMVFNSTRKMTKGHVAVVTRVVSSREIRVDHANWHRDGNIYLNAPVIDTSAPPTIGRKCACGIPEADNWAASPIPSRDFSPPHRVAAIARRFFRYNRPVASSRAAGGHAMKTFAAGFILLTLICGATEAQVILRLPTEERVVAFTFDACEQRSPNKLDTGISEYLVANRIPFTLFLVGALRRRQ